MMMFLVLPGELLENSFHHSLNDGNNDVKMRMIFSLMVILLLMNEIMMMFLASLGELPCNPVHPGLKTVAEISEPKDLFQFHFLTL